jgi:IS6 family transposase
MGIFSGRHYPKDVILWAVRWYCRYGVSYRDLEEMLTERGVPVDHTTIYRWVQKYGPELDKRTRWYRQTSPWFSDSWRVDETYIRVGGKWCYLYRAVTKDGRSVDFYMSTRRNTTAATRFLGKALRGAGHRGPHNGPRVICTDKAPTYAGAIEKLITEQKLPRTVEHRQVKYLNNVIEGDHGRLKRILGPKGGGFKTPVSAYRTLQGMEAMHALRKGQGRVFAFGRPNADAVIVAKAFAGV